MSGKLKLTDVGLEIYDDVAYNPDNEEYTFLAYLDLMGGKIKMGIDGDAAIQLGTAMIRAGEAIKGKERTIETFKKLGYGMEAIHKFLDTVSDEHTEGE